MSLNDKLKDIFKKHGLDLDDEIENEPAEEIVANSTRPPLEEAIDRAIYSLGEIAIMGTYGRSAECAREANETLTLITFLKEKYDEQNKIVAALQN